jgi:hypothetical protein
MMMDPSRTPSTRADTGKKKPLAKLPLRWSAKPYPCERKIQGERRMTDIADFINLTFCCQRATVITDFSDLERIRKSHVLTLNGGIE